MATINFTRKEDGDVFIKVDGSLVRVISDPKPDFAIMKDGKTIVITPSSGEPFSFTTDDITTTGDSATALNGNAAARLEVLATEIFFLVSGSPNAVVKIHSDNEAHAVTGTTSPTNFFSFTIPAGTMGPNSSLHMIWTATSNNNTSTRYTRIKINGTVVAQGALINTATAGRWYFIISNRNSLTSQVIGSSAVGGGSNLGFNATSAAIGTLTFDTAADLTVVVEGDLDIAGDNITCQQFECLLVP